MNIAFVINHVNTEQENYTTMRLGWKACNAGHQVSFIDLEDFVYALDGRLHAYAIQPEKRRFEGDRDFVENLKRPDAPRERIAVDELDVLMLRSDPAEETTARPWAPASALLFAQLAAAAGVIVLNDPTHLTDASNKTYFQSFPERVRPRTGIARDSAEIKRVIDELGGMAVIKPLQGSGGHGVFVVTPDFGPNLNQMIEAVSREGYVLVQEYLPKARDGDLRLLLLNGRALKVEGCYACIRRCSQNGDMRNNISAGGKMELFEPDADALMLAELVGPKLVRDGMYLVGLDIVGDKMMEINVDTPGGINFIEDLSGIDFSAAIIADLERKVRLRQHYHGVVDNATLAML